MGQLCYISLLEPNMNSRYTTYLSPLGQMILQANDDGLLGVWFESQPTRPVNLGTYTQSDPFFTSVVTQLREYFAGIRSTFDISISASGTDFQNQVWKILRTIPYGETWSYQDIANAIDNPKAVRAVGLANGKNPIGIIVPCHRVIGKNGKLTGYAGGLERKEKLLQLEKRFQTD